MAIFFVTYVFCGLAWGLWNLFHFMRESSIRPAGGLRSYLGAALAVLTWPIGVIASIAILSIGRFGSERAKFEAARIARRFLHKEICECAGCSAGFCGSSEHRLCDRPADRIITLPGDFRIPLCAACGNAVDNIELSQHLSPNHDAQRIPGETS